MPYSFSFNTVMSIISLLTSIISIYFQFYFRVIEVKYKTSIPHLMRIMLRSAITGASVALFLSSILLKWNYFISVYVLLPIVIALNLFLYKFATFEMAIFTLFKGLYYFGLFITSIFQYYQNTENFRLLALGFTTSLAIFEFVSAFENFYNLISNKNN